MTFPVPGGATFLRARSNLADVASPAAALADLGGLGLVATTGVAGFALQNATPVILTWTPPNDGQMHRFILVTSLQTTSPQTGGQVNLTYTDPGGFGHTQTPYPASLGAGGHTTAAQLLVPIGAGTTLQLAQVSALTAGAAILWAEIWGL